MRYCSIFVVVFAMGLSACSSKMNEVSRLAESNNFSAIAVDDVKTGKQARSNEQLKQLGVVNNNQLTAYYTSYDKTLNEYCKPSKAFLYGLKGMAENVACVYDTPLGKVFQYNWEQGKRWKTRLWLFTDRGMFL